MGNKHTSLNHTGHLNTSLKIITELKSHLINEERRARLLAENGDITTAITVMSYLEQYAKDKLADVDREKTASRKFFTGGLTKRAIVSEKKAITTCLQNIKAFLDAQLKLVLPAAATSAPTTDMHSTRAAGTGIDIVNTHAPKIIASAPITDPLPLQPSAISDDSMPVEHIVHQPKGRTTGSPLGVEESIKPTVSPEVLASSPTIDPPSPTTAISDALKLAEPKASGTHQPEVITGESLLAVEEPASSVANAVDRHALENDVDIERHSLDDTDRSVLDDEESNHSAFGDEVEVDSTQPSPHRKLSDSRRLRFSEELSDDEDEEEDYVEDNSPQLRSHRELDDDEDMEEIQKAYHLELKELRAFMESKRAFNKETELGQLLLSVIDLAEEIKRTNIIDAKHALEKTNLYVNKKIKHETYHDCASDVQGKPSPELKALGAAMMALGAAVFAIGLIFAPTILTFAASAAIAATGYGLFAKGKQATGLSLSMLELENANRIANVDDDAEAEELEPLLGRGKAA